jgi:hypothetical protein
VALTFTGSSYLSTTSVPAGKTIVGSPFTFAIWVYSNAGGGTVLDTGGDIGNYAAIVGSTTSGGAFTDWASIGNSAALGFAYLDMSHASYTEEIYAEYGSTSNGTWVHWAASWDGAGTYVLYKDGAVVTPPDFGGSLTTADAWAHLIVGGFDGDAQDAVMYNRVLTATEIASLYRSRTPLISDTSIIGYWPMNDSASAGTDLSGQGRTLTATGTVVTAGRSAPVTQNFGTSSGLTNSTGASAASTSSSGTVVTGESTGTTNSTGSSAAKLGRTATTAGSTHSTGASAAQLTASEASGGSTQSTGSSVAKLYLVASSSGLTNSSGSSTATTGSGGSFNSSGSTQSTGASAAKASAPSAGSTHSTGSSAAVLTLVASSAGLTRSSGDGAFKGSVSSAGLTVSSGASAASGGPPSGGGGDGKQTGSARRWLGALGVRRRIRR